MRYIVCLLINVIIAVAFAYAFGCDAAITMLLGAILVEFCVFRGINYVHNKFLEKLDQNIENEYRAFCINWPYVQYVIGAEETKTRSMSLPVLFMLTKRGCALEERYELWFAMNHTELTCEFVQCYIDIVHHVINNHVINK